MLRQIDAGPRSEVLEHLHRRNWQLADALRAELGDGPIASPAAGSAEERAPKEKSHLAVEPSPDPSELLASHESAPSPPPLHLRFEQLAQLDSATLATVLSDAPPEVLVLALASADDALVSRVNANLTRRAKRQLRRRLSELGPMRLSDIARARQSIVAIASRQLRHSKELAAV
jgi:hypothetical protein